MADVHVVVLSDYDGATVLGVFTRRADAVALAAAASGEVFTEPLRDSQIPATTRYKAEASYPEWTLVTSGWPRTRRWTFAGQRTSG
jgi:hypothetical protein